MKVDRETAELDFQRFVESLNISARKLENLETEKDEFIKGIEYGNILIAEDGSVSVKLDDPIEYEDNSEAISEIRFIKRRVTVGEMESKMIGKSDMEKTRRIFAFLAKQNSAIFKKVQADDYFLISQVAAFFLPR